MLKLTLQSLVQRGIYPPLSRRIRLHKSSLITPTKYWHFTLPSSPHASYLSSLNSPQNQLQTARFSSNETPTKKAMDDDHQTPTKLEYFDDMWKLQSQAIFQSFLQIEDGRQALILDSTIFYPQGGGQPADTGFITVPSSSIKFVVEDVRSKDGIVYHYGHVETSGDIQSEWKFERGTCVHLYVDESRRTLNSRLHSAGHLLDVSIHNVGLGHLTPGKAYHFPDGPYVEYKGIVPQNELQIKQEELEKDTNGLISAGMKVFVAVLPYKEAAERCGGQLPHYIPEVIEKEPLDVTNTGGGCFQFDPPYPAFGGSPCRTWGSSPRIVTLGHNLGGPCGGTHVADVSEIKSMKVSQIRSKKGMTKVFYTISS